MIIKNKLISITQHHHHHLIIANNKITNINIHFSNQKVNTKINKPIESNLFFAFITFAIFASQIE